MPTMNIKDPEVRRLAHELAARRHTTATGAVRQALVEALERERMASAGTAEEILALAARTPHDDDILTDADLYDEHGLPR